MKEIYIDDEKKTILVGKPEWKFTVTHMEHNPDLGTRKIWVKKID